MDKETLIRICDNVFESGISLGWEEASSEKEWYSQEFLEEIEKLGYKRDTELLHSGWIARELLEAIKISRIKKFLAEAGLNTTEDNIG